MTCAARRLPPCATKSHWAASRVMRLKPGARLVAIERLSDAAEIEGVALRGEHADAAVAAIDRLSNPSSETLTAIADKARTKAAQKKARTLLKAAQPAPVAAETGPAYREADQQKARDMVAAMRGLSSTADFAQLREAYAARRVAWVELLADADIQDAIEADFETASNVIRERLAADEAARADAERQRRALEQEQADRIAVCAGVEALSGDDIGDRRRAGARGVGRHAGDAGGVGRGARSPLCGGVPRRREAPRTPPARAAVRRTVAGARA